jgi:hypothetical protein
MRAVKEAATRTGIAFAYLLLAWGLGFGLAPDEAGSGFYEAAAQIIPVLLLVLLLEARFFAMHVLTADREDDLFHAIYRFVIGLLLLGSMIAAEFVALYPLARDDAAEGDPRWVYAGLVVGFASVAYTGIAGAPTRASADRDKD